jgi:uncharacterized protein (TIGR02246 family)
MFERFTEKARRVIFFARYEASQYGSPHIETEHVLLGLLREDQANVRRFLQVKGGARSIREEIESQITPRERISTSVEVPLSAECKRILNYSAEEAERLRNKYVDTAHFLLGILREENCFAARLLRERGLTLDSLREELGRAPSGPEPAATAELVSLSQLTEAWSSGNASEFARMFAPDGQFMGPTGDLWIGPARISEATRLILTSAGSAKTQGKIEDVQFVGTKAVMATLSWGAVEKSDKPNPACVRMTVILTQKPEGWTIVRAQATGLQPHSRTASV